jgi:hypothetical protein
MDWQKTARMPGVRWMPSETGPFGPAARRGAAAVFQRQYGLALAELTDLYEKPFWKGSAYGGNAWAPISTKVRDLVSAMAGGDSARARELREELLSMSHNTGKVAQKLNRLKQS